MHPYILSEQLCHNFNCLMTISMTLCHELQCWSYLVSGHFASLFGGLSYLRHHVFLKLPLSAVVSVQSFCTQLLLPRASMRKRGKTIVLYVCWHENHHFGKSRHLNDMLASLFSQSAQKTTFSPVQIVWQRSRMSWTASFTSLLHFILFKA